MSTIFYGVTGEGRGHATRAHTLVEDLRKEHRVVIFAPAMAYEMLAPLYEGTSVEVHEIPGLLFHYNDHGRIHLGRTAKAGLGYLRRMGAEIKKIKAVMTEERPDLVITDFEPILPRAAHALGIPYISVDHQHFLRTSDLSALPLHLRLHAQVMSRVVGLYYRKQRASVVSSFYFPPLKRGMHHVTQVGVLLKPQVLNATVNHGDYLVAYLRRFMEPAVERMLQASGRKVLVYGLGEQPSRGNLVFKPIDPKAFIDDLAGCAALVSTAGNQLVGEALYLRKPALVMPEAGNHEQEINGWFLQNSGAGISVPIEEVQPAHMHDFLTDLESYRTAINADGICGNVATLNAIRAHLPEGGYRPATVRPVFALGQQVG